MANGLIPLYYAIVKSFLDDEAHSAEEIVAALEPDYHGYKLLNRKDVEEALATAKENGILDECDYRIDAQGNLQVFFRMTDFGRDMTQRYI